MAAESKYKELLSKVHQGVPLEKAAEKTGPAKEEIKSIGITADNTVTIIPVKPPVAGASTVMETGTKLEIVGQDVEPSVEVTAPVPRAPEPIGKPADKRKRKPQADYQSLFFNRIDFTHRKPLYITAPTHRRLMRIVHLMDESKATISSYVENIILNHLDTFKEEIDIIYQTNNINPTE